MALKLKMKSRKSIIQMALQVSKQANECVCVCGCECTMLTFAISFALNVWQDACNALPRSATVFYHHRLFDNTPNYSILDCCCCWRLPQERRFKKREKSTHSNSTIRSTNGKWYYSKFCDGTTWFPGPDVFIRIRTVTKTPDINLESIKSISPN